MDFSGFYSQIGTHMKGPDLMIFFAFTKLMRLPNITLLKDMTFSGYNLVYFIKC